MRPFFVEVGSTSAKFRHIHRWLANESRPSLFFQMKAVGAAYCLAVTAVVNVWVFLYVLFSDFVLGK